MSINIQAVSRCIIFIVDFVDLFKTTSNFYIIHGLIFKGLMSYSSMITYYSAISQ